MILFSLLAALIGLALTAGGVYLLILGGSVYYLMAGLVLLLNAWLGFKRHGLTRPGRKGLFPTRVLTGLSTHHVLG